ncbi:MAG TPA: bifunctional (p)ppGpp synthetase/guanosine-3',5'-bis(diphosphate) 3'-pyrophosphohydrolase [Rhodothermales bacterium]|nr:bifunctional (p)ppGpp synthetase/guanosine-3',5'-bis(diphosphate) 3'-pyrophosphohydrolase [Rhodothermales bacterium]
MTSWSVTVRKALEEAPLDDVFSGRLTALLDMCRQNLPQVDVDLIHRAFILGHWAHRHDKRKSGEKFFFHPIAVAEIVANDIRVDDLSVAAALLHDTVEDTAMSLDMVRVEFGEEMAVVINGLTKIDEVFEKKEIGRAENWRKLILYMASDIRVIMVKFADRLHNMRTIGAKKPEAQLRIAHETMDFFVPLAHRFGVFKVKSELEDLCLKVTDRMMYNTIALGLEEKKEERDQYIAQFMEPIKNELTEAGFSFDIKGRSKSIFSIYNKMTRQGKSLEDIYDLYAIRIVMHRSGSKGKEDCWRAYSLITDQYKPLPDRFRDFISMPKSNGYQSLHTTVLGPKGKRVEIQIRSKEMDEIAERGVAAHWKYKEGSGSSQNASESLYAWVRDAFVSQEASENASEFVKDFRLNFYTEEIHVLTPKGDVITLPKDATPVDFAFQVHTEVGLHCVGAKVNGKMVPLPTKLKNGDEIEVLTSKRQTPNSDWIKFVVTQKAKSQVRAWINERKRKAIEKGKELLVKKMKKLKPELTESQFEKYVRQFKYSKSYDLYHDIGAELLDPDEFIRFVQHRLDQGHEKEPATVETLLVDNKQFESFLGTAQSSGHGALRINGEEVADNLIIQYASCCNPIPGDEVFGLISSGRGIRIHRTNCKNAKDLLLNHSDRILEAEWSKNAAVTFVTGIKVIGTDRLGMFNDISTVISKSLKLNIRSILVNSDQGHGYFEGTIVVDVHDISELHTLIQRLYTVEGVQAVYRYEG